MFQNLKAKELDVIITRKEEKILLEEALQYTSLSRKKSLKYYNQAVPLANQELWHTRKKGKGKMVNT